MLLQTRYKGQAIALAILALAGSIAVASLPSDMDNQRVSTIPSPMAVDGIYLIQKTQVVAPEGFEWNGEYVATDELEEFQLNKNEAVALRFLEDGRVRLDFLTSEEEGEVPNTLILSRREFEQLNLSFIKIGDEQSLAQEFSPYDETMESAGRSRGARSRTHSQRGRGGRRIGNCKAWVNTFLVAKGLIRSRINGISAWMMAGGLQQVGWKSTSRSKPKFGTTCVYKGGKGHSHGHTNVWNGRCWMSDIGCEPKGYPGSYFKPIGCFSKG